MKYLPIGSIVKLNNGKTKLMIIGYCKLMKEDKLKTNDYIACVYPLGVTSMKKVVAFKSSDINEVLIKGLEDDDYKELMSLMNNKKEY